MGKKPKSEKIAAATAAASSSTRRIDEVKDDESNQEKTTTKNETLLPFPKSNYYTKVEACIRKGNRFKTEKFLSQGSEKGCVHCLKKYAQMLMFGFDTLKTDIDYMYLCVVNPMHQKTAPLAFPLLTECVIRGDVGSSYLLNFLVTVMLDDAGSKSYYCTYNYYLMDMYWNKYYHKQGGVDDRLEKALRIMRKDDQASVKRYCTCCKKDESDTVTLKSCDGCNYYYYCSTECQKKCWLDGHAGECRQLAILKQYHRPYGKLIRDSLINGVDSQDIPELQSLRSKLGLDKPKAEYEDLLEQAKSGRIEPFELLFPNNKDGTVKVGSFPYPM